MYIADTHPECVYYNWDRRDEVILFKTNINFSFLLEMSPDSND